MTAHLLKTELGCSKVRSVAPLGVEISALSPETPLSLELPELPTSQ